MKVAYVLLVVGVLVGLGTWFTGIHSEPSLPPGVDATRHGFMVGRIEHGQSIDVADVVVFDADGKHRSADYYPLAVHASAAVSSRLVGADAGSVLMAFTVFFAAWFSHSGCSSLHACSHRACLSLPASQP